MSFAEWRREVDIGIRVLFIADAHWTGPAISARITGDPAIEVVGTVGALPDALALARAGAVDLVVADARRWLGAGESVLEEYRVLRAALPVVVVTADESRLEFRAALQSGASCYCPAAIDDRLLCEIIKRCAATKNVLDKLLRDAGDIPEIVREQFQIGSWPSASASRFPTASRNAELSEREKLILRMCYDGMSNAEIGEALGLKTRTVKNHVTSILRKQATNPHGGIGDAGSPVSIGH
jgi:DNA-binding NarL/FixJ family response regulator